MGRSKRGLPGLPGGRVRGRIRGYREAFSARLMARKIRRAEAQRHQDEAGAELRAYVDELATMRPTLERGGNLDDLRERVQSMIGVLGMYEPPLDTAAQVDNRRASEQCQGDMHDGAPIIGGISLDGEIEAEDRRRLQDER